MSGEGESPGHPGCGLNLIHTGKVEKGGPCNLTDVGRLPGMQWPAGESYCGLLSGWLKYFRGHEDRVSTGRIDQKQQAPSMLMGLVCGPDRPKIRFRQAGLHRSHKIGNHDRGVLL
jgi:hypothetical protein